MNLKRPVDGSFLTTTAPEAKPLELSYRAIDGCVNRIGHLLTIVSEGLKAANSDYPRSPSPFKASQKELFRHLVFRAILSPT
jgi:hypothetical protein